MVAVLEVSQAAREAILEAQVNAALAGHDIGDFAAVRRYWLVIPG